MTPFSAVLRSEWIKLSSLRSTRVSLALAAVLGLALSAVVAIVIGETHDDWGAQERGEFDPVEVGLVGAVPVLLVFLAIGAKAATSEYGAQMIRLTFAATPRRGRVLAAKALVVAGLLAVAGVMLLAACELLTQAILASYGVESATLTDPDLLRAALGTGLLAPQFPLLALALGFVLRSTAGAVIGVFVVLFGPAFLGGLLPSWWQDVLDYGPGRAGDAVAIGHLENTAAGISGILGAVLVLAWAALFLGVAWAVLERRDA
jgi:hypothetical protein